MKCGFCGYLFEEREGISGCAHCPAKCGRGMLKCPRCNYENPPEPAWLMQLVSFWEKKTAKLVNNS